MANPFHLNVISNISCHNPLNLLSHQKGHRINIPLFYIHPPSTAQNKELMEAVVGPDKNISLGKLLISQTISVVFTTGFPSLLTHMKLEAAFS